MFLNYALHRLALLGYILSYTDMEFSSGIVGDFLLHKSDGNYAGLVDSVASIMATPSTAQL